MQDTEREPISATSWAGCQLIAKGLPGGRRAGIEIELRDRIDGLELSICGVVGHPAALAVGNADSCGQNVDEIAAIPADRLVAGWNAERLARLVEVWRAWHLNGNAGCEHQRAAGWAERPIDPNKPTDTYGRHFEGQRSDSWNMLAWVRPDEHPEGLLTRPCEVCGYRYGTEWKFEPLPDDVIAFARELGA